MNRKSLMIAAAATALVVGIGSAAVAQGFGPGPGYGSGYGPGHGHGMMMGQGQGQGYAMQGKWGGKRGGPCAQGVEQEISVDQVKTQIEARLARHDNPNVKLGEVTESEDGKTITGTIVTKDDSLVRSMTFDKATGRMIARN